MKDFAKKRAFLDERVEPSVYGTKVRITKPTPNVASQAYKVGAAPSPRMAPSARKPIKLGPWLVLLVAILILGSVAEKAIQTYRNAQPTSLRAFMQSFLHKPAAKPTASQQATPAQAAQPTGPTFDFYTVLPGQSTAMPTLQDKPQPLPNTPAASTNTNPAQATNSSASNAPQIKSQYLLVVGAYKAKQQAIEMRSRLSLMNISSHITEAMVKTKMVYRVELGPYDTKDIASNVRDQIQQQGVLGATIMTISGS